MLKTFCAVHSTCEGKVEIQTVRERGDRERERGGGRERERERGGGENRE